jgi:hypothetical protein
LLVAGLGKSSRSSGKLKVDAFALGVVASAKSVGPSLSFDASLVRRALLLRVGLGSRAWARHLILSAFRANSSRAA